MKNKTGIINLDQIRKEKREKQKEMNSQESNISIFTDEEKKYMDSIKDLVDVYINIEIEKFKDELDVFIRNVSELSILGDTFDVVLKSELKSYCIKDFLGELIIPFLENNREEMYALSDISFDNIRYSLLDSVIKKHINNKKNE